MIERLATSDCNWDRASDFILFRRSIMFLPSLILVATFIGIGAMPYQVPLQGLQGGKRTLVLLDAMVSRHHLVEKVFLNAQKKTKA